ncbi:alpha/beta hydrolase [Shewanella marisflavi]|uniref:esterase/lipase family protein n=1 Tax=Shewanella marisflavi TaxID=260364 RepID=UPI00200C2B2A|nr:alpha/beta hydrolase [Shewanella marisflavi]MCL1043265.1 alpha/beta hydrolase [Shewanella marisflavi]
MKLVFVHGWSVTSTQTYGELPQVLHREAPPGLALDIQHIYLGRYISFNDAVTLEDLSIAFEAARRAELGDEPFSVITHSTGGPLIRHWLCRYYLDDVSVAPLQHLIMLAPANHGSALAQLGKSRVSRLKAWFDGVEPGQRVLDWLELGSDGQHDLNLIWQQQDWLAAGVYPFVLTGETIDSALYDYMNSYTGEPGSDGVVRVCAANMNFVHAKLEQQAGMQCESFDGECAETLALTQVTQPREACALAIIPKASHSHRKFGIMNSVTLRNGKNKPVVGAILACLAVNDAQGYRQLREEMVVTSVAERKKRFSMLVVRVNDHLGHRVTDFDCYLLAGDEYHASRLPKGLVADKQRNSVNGNVITFYLEASKLTKLRAGKLGLKLVPRPNEGFSHYKCAEFRCEPNQLSELLSGDQTLMLDIELERYIAPNTFSFAKIGDSEDFKGISPEG